MSDTNLENSNYTEKIAILTQADIFESLPNYYKEHAVWIDSFSYHDYNLYELQTNRFDYISGFPKSDRIISLDFPYSYMYKTQNTVLDDNGILHSDKTSGTILKGTVQALKGEYTVILHYRMENGIEGSGRMNIYENDQILSSIQLEFGKTHAVIQNISIQDTKTLNISIDLTEGTIIDIESIEYKRK